MPLAVTERPQRPRAGTLRRFDHNDVCAQVGEDLPADERALVSQVEDAIGAKHLATFWLYSERSCAESEAIIREHRGRVNRLRARSTGPARARMLVTHIDTAGFEAYVRCHR